MSRPDVGIVVPCYNEAQNVAPLVQAVEKAFWDSPHALSWEIVFVDDNSPDGTMQEIRALTEKDPRVRGILRIGRKGLSSAVIEGALSSSAPVIAVMDGDLQHDEACLPEMVAMIKAGECDLSVASRHIKGGTNRGLARGWRRFLSNTGIWAARHMLSVPLSDPMSGFFAVRRTAFEKRAFALRGDGFKILLDIVLASPEPLKTREFPMVFRDRTYGKSKLGAKVMFSYARMLFSKYGEQNPKGWWCLLLGILTMLGGGTVYFSHRIGSGQRRKK